MGLLRSLFTGSTDPVISAALEPVETFSVTNLVDDQAIPPEFYGVSSYVSSTAPAPRVSRREAQQVAAVKRSRDLIAGSLGTLPLVTVKPDLSVDRLSWLMQPERDVPRSVTMTRTIEDLFYEGIAWWKVVRFGWDGKPVEVVRLDPRSVDVLPDGRVHSTLDGHRGTADEWPTDAELIRFDSPNDPLLVAGARAIRQCLALDVAAANASDGVPPTSYFRPADGVDPGTDDEIIAMLDAWQAARRSRATGYVPAALTLESLGWNPEQLQLVEQRQHAVLEIARVAGVDPEELGVSTTSRTYANQFDRRKAFLDFTLGAYRAAVEDRLSMPDVTPRGTVVRFDLDAFLRTDAKTRWEAAKVGLEVGAITREEVREGEGRPALPATTQETRPMPETAPALSLVKSGDVDSMTFAEAVAGVEFADGEHTALTFDAPAAPEVFSVDTERRVIRGLAVPYGVVSEDGRTFKFSKGSIQFTDPKRIKLLIGHDWSQAVGHATALEDTDEGLIAAFKVARGPEGDRALSMAEDGVWDGLSVGIGKGMKTRFVDGVHEVISAPLREISQTPAPAYAGARITQVAAESAEKGTTMPEDTATETESGALDFTAITDAITQGFADLAKPQERETVSAGRPTVHVDEPSPYRFDGISGSASLVDDMRSAQQGDASAQQRLDTFMGEVFAVTTGNVGALNPTKNRPDLYVPGLTFTRPLWDAVSNGVVEDRTPFTIPKFATATGLVAAHTEGVEPTPGGFTATSQTVTPAPMSGKVEINREVIDQGGSPQADAMVWGEMQNAYYEAVEQRIATVLGAVPTTEVNLASAVDSALVDAMTGVLVGLQFQRGGNRFTRLVLDGTLFPALVNAKDTTGRKLLPVLGPTNAQGQVGDGFEYVQIGNLTGRAAWALGTGAAARSYLFVPSSVWAWASAPKRFTFEYQVKSVDLAIWGYSAAAVIRDGDVKPIDYTTADA